MVAKNTKKKKTTKLKPAPAEQQEPMDTKHITSKDAFWAVILSGAFIAYSFALLYASNRYTINTLSNQAVVLIEVSRTVKGAPPFYVRKDDYIWETIPKPALYCYDVGGSGKNDSESESDKQNEANNEMNRFKDKDSTNE